VRRLLKPAVWTVVFLVCAGLGAYIAAHTDPFPPGVDRPTGETGSAPVSPSPEPRDERWTGTMRTVAEHRLYVGGTCRSRWRTRIHLSVDDRGAVQGTAVALPVGLAHCDFEQSQEQARRIRMTVGGTKAQGAALSITFVDLTPDPLGSTDLGGFLTFLQVPRLACDSTDGAMAHLSFHKEQKDGNRGVYTFDGAVDLRVVNEG
jgi:hypothetical protein